MEPLHEEAPRRPVGLEVDARDDRLAEQERQHVIAVLALVGRRVDLDAVAEAEQPLGALAIPHQRVEGRDQRPRLDPPRPAGGGLEVGCAAPALDLDRQQRALLDELGEPVARLRHPEPEIVAQVALGRDAERPGRDAEQPALRLGFIRRRRADDRRREHALGQVVDALEAAPRRRRDEAGPEQPFERVLAVAPAPPGAAPGAALRELAGAERSARLDLRQHGATKSGRSRPNRAVEP